MTQHTFSCNLLSARFPLSPRFSPRAQMIGESSQSFVPEVDSRSSQQQVNRETAGIEYCENILATPQGVESIMFDMQNRNIIPAADTEILDQGLVTAALATREAIGLPIIAANQRVLLHWRILATGTPSIGLLEIRVRYRGEFWEDTLSTVVSLEWGVGKYRHLTFATVAGVTFIYIRGNIFFHFLRLDAGVISFTSVSPAGLNPTGAIGITALQGHLILYSSHSIAWSSVVDPLDFVPSLVSGAGGGSIEDTRGEIIFAAPVHNAVILYTSSNAVSMLYTGERNQPWLFTAIPGAGGIDTHRSVGDSEFGEFHVAFTHNGIQEITANSAEQYLPDFSTFIDAKVFDFYNFTSGTLTSQVFSETLVVSVAFVAGRYVCLSYRPSAATEFQHILVYDTLIDRYGKFRIRHSGVYDIAEFGEESNVIAPLATIGILGPNQLLVPLDGWQISTPTTGGAPSTRIPSNGVGGEEWRPLVILGKFQHSFGKWISLQRVELSSRKLHDGQQDAIESLASPSLDAVNFSPPTSLYVENATGESVKYLSNLPALSHRIVIIGQFRLATVLIWFFSMGHR